VNGPITASPADPALADQVNILIVDDEPKNLLVLETVLNDPGYRLVRANSGEDALLALMAHEFAVLVLDVRMPGMSGFELAQMVKERRKTARVPIIFLTAYFNEDQHVLEGYGTGAVDYLLKPVNASVLRSKVAVFADVFRKGRALEVANRALTAEVSERRRAEARLSELNDTLDRRVTERTLELQMREDQLRDANRRKDEFLATLAHELRNPLAPVRNAVHILRRKGGAAPELAWASELIERQVRAMSRLIDDLMDISRINQGKIDLQRERLDLVAALGDAIEMVRPVIDESGHRLHVDVPQGEVPVHGDRARLAQAFTNLLNNACKYTDPGGRIDVNVRRDGSAVEVAIRDTGIGIAPDRLEGVFEMFSQVEAALARSRGGLGVGLSLTRNLIEMHGGAVAARSRGLGQGSEFVVRLPLALAQAGGDADPDVPVSALAPPAASGVLRIVVADDNTDAAETLTALLELLGHSVRQVHDGAAAVAAVAEFDPQLVLLDLGMPKLNGYEACMRIRALPQGSARTVVAITGWGQPEDRQKSAAAGFDLHLVKPVSPNQLEELAASLLARGLSA
jgi:signal transduction histidine kinase